MSLTTRQVIKSDWLNIAASDTTSDAMIDRLIAAVDAEIASICDQPVEATAKTIVMMGNGKRWLTLPWTSPVTLTTVEARVNPDSAWSVITSQCTTDQLSSMQRLFRSPYPWDLATHYRITATVGYSVIPADIVVCANEMVVELYNETAFAPNGSTLGIVSVSEVQAGQTVTKALQSMRPKVERRLLPYRRVTI